MFCQKCGKENSDDAIFCNSCGLNFTKKSTSTAAATYIQLKENEIRLLQEKFKNETLTTGPLILKILGGLFILLGVFTGYRSEMGSFEYIFGGVIFLVAFYWSHSKSAAANETEIKLYAAKAELEKMKNA